MAIYRPDAPTNPRFTISGKEDSATVTWTSKASPGAGKPWDKVEIQRQLDLGSWVTVATLPGGSSPTWKDSSVTTNHTYNYRLRSINSAGASAWAQCPIAVTTTPDPPKSRKAVRISSKSVRITWEPTFYDTSYVQVYRGNGSWSFDKMNGVPFDSFTYLDSAEGSNSYTDLSAPSGQITYALATGGGARSSGVSTTNVLQPITTALPPDIKGAPSGIVAAPASFTVTVIPHCPDGSVNGGVDLVVDGYHHVRWGEWDPDKGVEFEFSGEDAFQAGDHTITARVQGVNGVWGPTQSPIAFTAADPPSVTIESPEDGSTLFDLPVEVKWSCFDPTGVSHARGTVVDQTGKVVYEAPISEGDPLVIGGQDFTLTSGMTYRAVVAVTGGSGITGTAEVRFRMNFAPPARPTASVSNDVELMRAVIKCYPGDLSPTSSRVAGHAQAGMGLVPGHGGFAWKMDAFPKTVSYDIYRILIDGTEQLVAAGVKEGEPVIDSLPPLNTTYHYRVIARAATGATNDATVENLIDAMGAVALNFGPGYGKCAVLVLNLQETQSLAVGGEGYYFPGVTDVDGYELPVWYPSKHYEGNYSLTGVVLRQDIAAIWRECLRSPSPMIYRSIDGEVKTVAVDGSVDRDAKTWRRWDVNVSLREVLVG